MVEKVVGYKKIKFNTHENVGFGDVRLPDMQMHTTSFLLTVDEALCERVGGGRAAGIEGMRGLGRALETVSCLALLCEPHDIGQTLGDQGPDEDVPSRDGQGPRAGFDPTIFLFDHVPGGVGIAERIYERADELLDRARTLITRCGCRRRVPRVRWAGRGGCEPAQGGGAQVAGGSAVGEILTRRRVAQTRPRAASLRAEGCNLSQDLVWGT